MTIKHGVFDNGHRKSAGSDVTFAHADRGNVATWDGHHRRIDPAGGANATPRYDAPITVADNVSAAWAVTSLTGLGSTAYVLASGRDHDGQTPIAVVLYPDSRQLKFIRGWQVVRTVTLTRGATGDLLVGQAEMESNWAHGVAACAIYDGLIVFQCQVVSYPGLVATAESFVYTQDFGQTFHLVPIDGNPHSPTQADMLGESRVTYYSLRNPTPWGDLREPSRRVTFTGSNYDQAAGGRHGGQIYLFDATREFVGGAWTVLGGRTVYQLGDPSSNTWHIHSAGCVLDPANNKRYVLGYFGDAHSLVVRVTIHDLHDYQNASLTVDESWAYSVTDGSNNISGWQGIDFAPSPIPGRLVAKADTDHTGIIEIDATQPKWSARQLSTSLPWQSKGSEFAFTLHHDRGRYIANMRPVSNPAWSNETYGFIYGDGVRWLWVQRTPRGDDAAGRQALFIYGDWLISVVSGVLYRMPAPKPRNIRPLLVAPGGTNRWPASPTKGTLSAGALVVDGTRDVGGKMLWPAGFRRAGGVMPQFPTDAAFWGASQVGTSSDFFIATGQAASPTGTHILSAYIIQEHGNLACELRSGNGALYASRHQITGPIQSTDRPYPLHQHYAEAASNYSFRANLAHVSGAGSDFKVVYAFASVVHRAGAPPYPLPAGATGANEYASLASLGCGATWTVGAKVIIPRGQAWDFSWYQSQGITEIPLLTIWGDADNYIYFYAEPGASITATGSIKAGIYKAGALVDTLVWTGLFPMVEQDIGVVVSQSGAGGSDTITATVQVGGSIKGVDTSTAGSVLAAQPAEIRFSNADQSNMTSLGVVGYYVDTAAAADQAAQQAVLQGRKLHSDHEPESGLVYAGA